MRDQLRRSLFAAAFAGAALAGCGGGGGGGGLPPAPAPAPAPSPPPAAAGFFLLGSAGKSSTGSPADNIPFYDQPVGASPFSLAYADPSALPMASAVTGGANQLAMGGKALDVATVSEYTQSGGSATAWGARYRVYSKLDATGTGYLYATDLRKTGSPPAIPAPVQLSSGNVGDGAKYPGGLSLCSIAASVFDNYSSAASSWVLFHAKGPDFNCGTLDDQFVGIQLSMTSSSSALALAQVEPIEALHDATGSITGYLAINHPDVCAPTLPATTCTTTCGTATMTVASGSPVCPVPLQRLGPDLASFNTNPTMLTTLQGTGLNVAGGEFLHLGISPGGVWLYVDANGIYAVNANATAATTPSALVTIGSGDTVTSRAVFDGTNAYVAINNASGSRIVLINTSNNMTTTVTDPKATGVTLVGVTSNNLVYLANDGSGVRSVVKSDLSGLADLVLLTPTQTVDSLMGVNASTAPVAFLVGDTVYFTVADTAGAYAKQAFFTVFKSGGAPTTAPVLDASGSASVSAVIGVVAPSSIPTTGTYANAGALVLTGGATYAPGTTRYAAFANGNPATGAALGLYGPGGTLANKIGALSPNNASTNSPLMSPITGVALASGPVQAGMPAMLELIAGANGAPTVDMAVYSTDGTAIPLTQISGFNP